jgi:hypothetical protein
VRAQLLVQIGFHELTPEQRSETKQKVADHDHPHFAFSRQL